MMKSLKNINKKKNLQKQNKQQQKNIWIKFERKQKLRMKLKKNNLKNDSKKNKWQLKE